MPFKIKNLAQSRRDPNKRGHNNPTVRRASARMRIGQRRLRIGKSIVISDDTYAANKSQIDTYVDQKLISLLAIGDVAAEAFEVQQPQLHAPSPEPPAPSPDEGSPEASGVVEISTDGPDESEVGAVILDMASTEPEEEKAEEPEVEKKPELKKKATSKKESSEEPEKAPSKRASRRRKKKDD